MNEESSQVRVSFHAPFPLFPLEAVSLLPHAVLPLMIFEPRYRQMVERVLDTSGQIAMAVFDGASWREDYEGSPPLRPAVCVGRVFHHEKLPDGRYRIMLQGICRALIRQEIEPTDERLYRQAYLEPMNIDPIDETTLAPMRETILRMLGSDPLTDLTTGHEIREQLKQPHVPTSAVLEIIALSILTDRSTQYELLAEGDPVKRGQIVEHELLRLARMIDRAKRQADPDAPKGVVWN